MLLLLLLLLLSQVGAVISCIIAITESVGVIKVMTILLSLLLWLLHVESLIIEIRSLSVWKMHLWLLLIVVWMKISVRPSPTPVKVQSTG